MLSLVAGLVLFLGVHSVAIVAPGLRARGFVRLGEGAWKGSYSLVALIGLALIVYGFSLARRSPVVLYSPPYWTHYLAAVLMLPVFPLLLAAYLPGRIRTAAKHPMLAAVKFWALAHLLANGTLADCLLFGGFLAWAVVDRISLKRRPAQAMRIAPPGRWNDAIALIGGLALYAWVIGWAHLAFIGEAIIGGRSVGP
jgi:uncharacterized membrane protein